MTLLPVRDPETIETRLSDGTALVADVYRPATGGSHPVLLMRQPYGRKIASTVVLAHPAWYAAHGYVVMIQDVRGRGDSPGRFRILADDVADGAETLATAADLPGGDGRVGTYGFSYQGMTQYMALAGAMRADTKRPDAMAVIMAAWNVRDHWAFEGGAFRLQGNQFWGLQMAMENARIAGDAQAYQAFRHAIGAMAGGAVPARLDVFEAYPRYTHYNEWMADDPAYWRSLSPHEALRDAMLDIPILHVGGWLDIMLESTFAAYHAFGKGGAHRELMIGPWQHLPWGQTIGALDCGPAAGAGVDEDVVAFFDHVLKGKPAAGAAVRLFDLGTKEFRGFDDLPATTDTSFYLSSGGRAAPTTTDGTLLPDPAGQAAIDRIVNDPWRPAPCVGLHLGTPSGYVSHAIVDDRADVAVYTSEPLDAPMTLMGAVAAELWLSCSHKSLDLAATLSVVAPDSSSLAVTRGHKRIPQLPSGGPVRIGMRMTGITVPAGHRLRLSLQAASWPAFMVNPGSGARPEDTELRACEVTTTSILSGTGTPSRLVVSVA